MLAPQPRWIFEDGRSLTQWYCHVRLLSDRVVGQWFCATRDRGGRVWRRRFLRPNNLVGVDPRTRIIVASEWTAGGPWTGTLGCYGIGLDDGRLRWTSDRDGILGWLVRACDFLPLFTNELRDTAQSVRDGEVHCDSGRVLEAATGRLLRRERPAATLWWHTEESKRLYNQLGRSLPVSGEVPPHDYHLVPVDDTHRITHRPGGLADPRGAVKRSGELDLYGVDTSGAVQWRYTPTSTGYHADSTYYGYRYARPWVYFIVAEKPLLVPIPDKPRYVHEQLSRRHVLTLDARSGRVVQELTLDGEWKSARIEDVDEQAMLISVENRRLFLFDRHA